MARPPLAKRPVPLPSPAHHGRQSRPLESHLEDKAAVPRERNRAAARYGADYMDSPRRTPLRYAHQSALPVLTRKHGSADSACASLWVTEPMGIEAVAVRVLHRDPDGDLLPRQDGTGLPSAIDNRRMTARSSICRRRPRHAGGEVVLEVPAPTPDGRLRRAMTQPVNAHDLVRRCRPNCVVLAIRHPPLVPPSPSPKVRVLGAVKPVRNEPKVRGGIALQDKASLRIQAAKRRDRPDVRADPALAHQVEVCAGEPLCPPDSILAAVRVPIGRNPRPRGTPVVLGPRRIRLGWGHDIEEPLPIAPSHPWPGKVLVRDGMDTQLPQNCIEVRGAELALQIPERLREDAHATPAADPERPRVIP